MNLGICYSLFYMTSEALEKSHLAHARSGGAGPRSPASRNALPSSDSPFEQGEIEVEPEGPHHIWARFWWCGVQEAHLT